MDSSLINTIIAAIISSIITFLILHLAGKSIYNRVKIYFSKRIDAENFLPKEELQNQRQIFYLIMIVIFVIMLFFTIECALILEMIATSGLGLSVDIVGIIYGHDFNDYIYAIFDIIISAYMSLKLDLKNSHKDRLIFLLLVPFTSLMLTSYYLGPSFIPFIMDETVDIFLDLIHNVAFIYFIYVYYKKFMKYAKNNVLGRTIILLVALLLVATLITLITEQTSIIDSINMVSNAFVSNGYMVMGTTQIGKINVLIIIWGGYILSGVGTATLTAAIVRRQYDSKLQKRKEKYAKQFDELEELIEFNNGELR